MDDINIRKTRDRNTNVGNWLYQLQNGIIKEQLTQNDFGLQSQIKFPTTKLNAQMAYEWLVFPEEKKSLKFYVKIQTQEPAPWITTKGNFGVSNQITNI